MVGRALTDRELELVRLLALGHTNGEIGTKMHIALATVQTKIGQVAEKMDLAPNGTVTQRTPGVLRAQIVRRAYRLGLIE
jgi:DNA-binding NarL/FixJ family response regulator